MFESNIFLRLFNFTISSFVYVIFLYFFPYICFLFIYLCFPPCFYVFVFFYVYLLCYIYLLLLLVYVVYISIFTNILYYIVLLSQLLFGQVYTFVFLGWLSLVGKPVGSRKPELEHLQVFFVVLNTSNINVNIIFTFILSKDYILNKYTLFKNILIHNNYRSCMF